MPDTTDPVPGAQPPSAQAPDPGLGTPAPADIRSLIHAVRGQQVMLDSDLAALYQVETKSLNRAAKRNEDRFPEDFRFRLTREEVEDLRCQFGTLAGQGPEIAIGRTYLPFAYTEQGVAMLSGVLRSKVAVDASVRIMRAFVEMRRFIASNAGLFERVRDVELRQLEYQRTTDKRFERVFDCIEERSRPGVPTQKIFFQGQVYDALSLLEEIVAEARAFDSQYPTLEVRRTSAFHDRFLVIDGGKAAYHIGASLKDAGKNVSLTVCVTHTCG